MDTHDLVYAGNKPSIGKPYLPSKDLVEAVNVAIALERPLLLKGEPGSGKTCLAASVGISPITPDTLCPLYPREPEAVTKWRKLHSPRTSA